MELVFLIVASAIIVLMVVLIRAGSVRAFVGRAILSPRRLSDQPPVFDEAGNGTAPGAGGKASLRFAGQLYGYNREQVENVVSELLTQRAQLTERLESLQASSGPAGIGPTVRDDFGGAGGENIGNDD